MPSTELRDAVLFLAPGFIALRVYHAAGFRRPRSDWHWAVWSVIASLPLDLATRTALPYLPPEVGSSALGEGSVRLILAVAAGLLLSWLWWQIRFSGRPAIRKAVRALTDSLWDQKLEEAARAERPIEVETTSGDVWFGWFEAAREDAGAEAWLRDSAAGA